MVTMVSTLKKTSTNVKNMGADQAVCSLMTMVKKRFKMLQDSSSTGACRLHHRDRVSTREDVIEYGSGTPKTDWNVF